VRLYLPGRLHGGIARYPRVPCGKEHKGRGLGRGVSRAPTPQTTPRKGRGRGTQARGVADRDTDYHP